MQDLIAFPIRALKGSELERQPKQDSWWDGYKARVGPSKAFDDLVCGDVNYLSHFVLNSICFVHRNTIRRRNSPVSTRIWAAWFATVQRFVLDWVWSKFLRQFGHFQVWIFWCLQCKSFHLQRMLLGSFLPTDELLLWACSELAMFESYFSKNQKKKKSLKLIQKFYTH